ncbi:MAG: phospho-sugar mutase [Bacilli bacterium]|nr:phospho-sugar mutase [Bacilli bacterium]
MYISNVEKWKNFSGLLEELREELSNMNEKELEDAFYTDLGFGTGGMRGIIGAGTNRMNIYTLRKANYGYAKFILSLKVKNPSVVIAYDSRHKSKEFALESAKVMGTLGIKAYLFNKITPTPELSFAVRYLKATGGIVVTASHNPANYNGYKIYDSDGCQLVPDLADQVIEEISNAPDAFEIFVENENELVSQNMVEYLDDLIDKKYLEAVKSIAVYPKQNKEDFKVVFTPLHGTAAYLGKKLLNETGYNVFCVEEQMVPDPNFTTVKSPNPEVMSAFDYGIKLAEKENADLVIATDPDADRVGLAVNNEGKYQLLTGNQTGALLLYYLTNNKPLPKQGVVFNTIVTSSLGADIAKSKGLEVISTLTGFKFIGEQAKLLENSSKEFFFGYEESYGYVVKDFVRDKDSLQALLLCSEMACFYKNSGKNLIQVLEEIFNKFGYYVEDLVNIALEGKEGADKIDEILNHFRKMELKHIQGLAVLAKEDYLEQKRFKNGEVTNISLPKSNVLKYLLNDGSWFVLRPSGTEPKMKIYVGTKDSSKEEAIKKIAKIKEAVLAIVKSV